MLCLLCLMPAVEAALGDLSKLGPLIVSAAGSEVACYLQSYSYDYLSVNIYKLMSGNFLKDAGAKPGSAFAIFRCADVVAGLVGPMQHKWCAGVRLFNALISSCAACSCTSKCLCIIAACRSSYNY